MISMKTTQAVSTRSMVFIAVAAAMLCIAAPFSIPMPGLVPISLGTFAIYIIGSVLGAKKSVLAVTVYILLGVFGLPVFTGFTGGFAKLLGVTGGYIIGYVPGVLLCGLMADRFPKRIWAMPVGMILGTLTWYTFGTAWYMIFTGSELVPALMGCVVPFLIGDGIKIAAATAVAYPLRSKLAVITGSGNSEE